MPRFAMGTAAALASLRPEIVVDGGVEAETMLRSCWSGSVDRSESRAVVDLVHEGLLALRRWRVSRFAGFEA